SGTVAPLAGSVDRNRKFAVGHVCRASLPSRGAWIEITMDCTSTLLPTVAPLAGSVDRNLQYMAARYEQWAVAPLAGSVDRNLAQLVVNDGGVGRSPRGERG